MYQVIGIVGLVCTFIGLIWSILIATTPYSKYPKDSTCLHRSSTMVAWYRRMSRSKPHELITD